MISLSVTDFSRKLKTMLDLVEFRGEEIILIRNKHKIARILPGAPYLTAMEAMSDLYRTLSPDAGETWEKDSKLEERLTEVTDPWES
ncbi:MAG TPA: type II toxin-antitoxin system Phd/YefM family antitoxin [Spirochaeta sp.]|nr:type II toxin-antitoxin system Phd/YefM family antitoxin [Spirochaeta sp.]